MKVCHVLYIYRCAQCLQAMSRSMIHQWTNGMSKLKALPVLFVILSASFGVEGQDLTPATNEASKISVALSFINDYVKHCDDKESEPKTTEWIEGNKLVTKEFKKAYKNLIDEARRKEPELGLGLDPIFNAQDYPEKGFELLKSDNGEYVTVRGKDWPTFTTVIRLILTGDKWIVDGAGIINIPEDRRQNN
jgi:hypothetical protein